MQWTSLVRFTLGPAQSVLQSNESYKQSGKKTKYL